MRKAALHHLTIAAVAPERLPGIAAAAGFDEICLFTHVPEVTLTGAERADGGRGSAPFPLVTHNNLDAVCAAMHEHGTGVLNCEYFPISQSIAPDRYRDGLALGAALGARRAVTHIHDPNPARAVDGLGRLCDIAGTYGLDLGLEFMGLSPACNSTTRALWFVQQVNRDNLGIAIDALHLVRTGGTASDVRALPEERIAYAQLCDGSSLAVEDDYRREALNRLMPVEGIFPLLEILSALPEGTDLDIEVPCTTSPAFGSLDRARTAMAAARKLFSTLDQPR